MTPQPQRIQRKRTRGWKMPGNTVYVGRPTKWGNPVKVRRNSINPDKWAVSPQDAVDLYRVWITTTEGRYLLKDLRELRGMNLACWCKSDQPCHADILLELANRQDFP